jgi:hypothetical protein
MPWIHHPALSEPVSWWRWLKYQIGERLYRWGQRLEDSALYPDRKDDIPF